MEIFFENYRYYPALRTRPAEMYGYSKLTGHDKDQLIPIITLGSWPRQEGINESMAQTQKAVGNKPFILDLTRELSHQNQEIRNLLNPDENFKAWAKFAAENENVIPVVQIPVGAKTPQIIRQARGFERKGARKPGSPAGP